MQPPLLPQATETLAAQRSDSASAAPTSQVPVQILETPDGFLSSPAMLVLSGKAISLENNLLTLQTSAGNFQIQINAEVATQPDALVDALKQAYVSKVLLDLVIAPPPSLTDNTFQTATLIIPQKIIPPQPSVSIADVKLSAPISLNPAVGTTVEAILLPPAEDIVAPQPKTGAMALDADPIETTTLINKAETAVAKGISSFFEAAKNPEKPLTIPLSAPIVTEKSLSSLASPPSILSIKIDAIFPSDYLDEKISLLPSQFLSTAFKKTDGVTTLLQVGKEALFIHDALPIVNSEKVVFSVASTKPTTELPSPEIETQLQSVEIILQEIIALAPRSSAEASAPSIARPDHSLTQALLSLLGCFSHDDASGWVGAATLLALKKNKKENLVHSLEKAIKQEKTVFQERPLADWTGITIPFQDTFTNQFQPIHFYYRHIYQEPPEQQNDALETRQKKTKMTRFLVDIHLSYLGAMQLDGLSQEKRLDLIVRSEDTLPSPLPTELTTHYLKALDGIGFRGSLHFQTGRQNWIEIKQKATGTGVVV